MAEDIRTAIQRAISTVLFMSRGAALFYYGDEIGMKTTPPTRKQDVKDPIGITGRPKEKGRDGERTPMQWNASPNAGFTTGRPWLPVPPGAAPVVVSVNFTAEPQTVNLKIPCAGLCEWKLKTLLKSPGGEDPASPSLIHLAPFGVYAGEVR